MLRAKQITSFSQCARNFYLAGSRCPTADGATCTCTDDDSSIKGKNSKRTDSLLKQHTFKSAPTKAGTPTLKEAFVSVGNFNHHISSTSNSAHEKVHTTQEDAQDSQNVSAKSSFTTTQSFVKAGISTVNMLSDLIHHRIPSTDNSAHFTSLCNNVVEDKTSVSSTKSANEKSQNQTKNSNVQPRSNNDNSNNSNSNSTPANRNVKACSTSKAKSKQNNPGKSTKYQRTENQSHYVPQRTKNQYADGVAYESRYTSKSSDDKPIPSIANDFKSCNKFQHPARNTKFQGGSNNVHAVELYHNALQHLKWGPKAEKFLNGLNCKLDRFQANQVLKSLHDHSVALGFFKWLKHQSGFKHDAHTYTTMIGILGQAKQFGTLRRLLDEMTKEGCYPNIVTYNRIINSYGKANYIHEAVQVFNEMQNLGYEPDRVTYCTLIDIHAKAGYLEVALDLYRKMQEVGLSPDTFTYSAMVHCLGKAGHLAAAYNLFCEMIDQGCIPNLVTYNIMIALQAKARNYQSTIKLYRDMQSAGFRPDKITYSIVMEALGHWGQLNEAENVFLEMQQYWVPDEPVYGLLVDMWGKVGNVEKARAWFQSMLDAGLWPNVPTCNSLLSAFLRMQRFKDARDVLQNMMGMGLAPSLQTYTLLLSCCTETASNMRVCGALLEITKHPAHGFLVSLPNAEPGGQNVRSHAGRFLEMIHSEDRESKRGILDAVIDFLYKSELKEEAGFVWEVAAERNFYPDSLKEKSSAYWLINLHVMSEGTAITALSRTLAWFQRQMMESGYGPRRIDIITGWGRRSRVTGSSLVRQSVEELLNLFRFPFYTENGNSGCFVGCGDALSKWLLNSYVDRMHLL